MSETSIKDMQQILRGLQKIQLSCFGINVIRFEIETWENKRRNVRSIEVSILINGNYEFYSFYNFRSLTENKELLDVIRKTIKLEKKRI